MLYIWIEFEVRVIVKKNRILVAKINIFRKFFERLIITMIIADLVLEKIIVIKLL